MSIAYDSHVLSGEKCMGGLNKQGGQNSNFKVHYIVTRKFRPLWISDKFCLKSKRSKIFCPRHFKASKSFQDLIVLRKYFSEPILLLLDREWTTHAIVLIYFAGSPVFSDLSVCKTVYCNRAYKIPLKLISKVYQI